MPIFGAIAGAGTGLQVLGRVLGAIQARRLGRFNAKVARANATSDAFALENQALQEERLADMLDDEMAFVEEVTAFDLDRIDEQLAREEGRARAIIGASGVAFEGSPQAVLEENARQGQIQRLARQFQGTLQIRALTEEQTQRRFRANLARFGASERLRIGRQQSGLARFIGNQQFTAGLLGAAGTGLRGASLLAPRGGSTITSGASSAPADTAGVQ